MTHSASTPAVYIVGDSTVEDNTPPFRGWGWALHQYLQPGIPIHNHALSGRSSKSFREEGLFRPVAQAMQSGDFLLIQFGHNDEKDDERHTDPGEEFAASLMQYCDAARAKGAQPILLTPVCRRFFVGKDSLMYTHGEYPRTIRNLAAEESIPLCDLKSASRQLYLRLGEEETAKLFVRLQPGEHPDFPAGHDDKTHFNAYGAKIIAGLVAEGLRQLPCCNALFSDAS